MNQSETVTAIIFNTDNLPFVHDFLKEGRNMATIEDIGSSLLRYNNFLELYGSIFYILHITASASAVCKRSWTTLA